jgi:hypothetical protein
MWRHLRQQLATSQVNKLLTIFQSLHNFPLLDHISYSKTHEWEMACELLEQSLRKNYDPRPTLKTKENI